jgi:hypothetical protein
MKSMKDGGKICKQLLLTDYENMHCSSQKRDIGRILWEDHSQRSLNSFLANSLKRPTKYV